MRPLLKDGQCRVYLRRPWSCRNHTAVGPKELCFSEETRLDQKYLFLGHDTNIYITKQLMQVATDSGAHPFHLEHIGLLLAKKLNVT